MKKTISILLACCLVFSLTLNAFAAGSNASDLLKQLPYTGDKNLWKLPEEQAEAYAEVIQNAVTRAATYKNEWYADGTDVYVTFFDVDGNTCLWICGLCIYNEPARFPLDVSIGNNKHFNISFEEVWQWDGLKVAPLSIVSDYNRTYVNLWQDGLEVFTEYGGTDVDGADWNAMYPFSDGKIAAAPKWCRARVCLYDYRLEDANIKTAGKSKRELAKEYLNTVMSNKQWPQLPFDWDTLDVQYDFLATVSGGTGFEKLATEYGDYSVSGIYGAKGTLLTATAIAKNDDRWARASTVLNNLDSYAKAASKPSSWAEKEVNEAIEAGIVPEYLQEAYSKNVSRANVAEMFVNLIETASGKTATELMEEKGVSVDKSAFTDTWDDSVFTLNALGIVKGTGDGKFMPDASFTRGQVVAMLNRVARLLGVDTEGYTHSFTDTKGHWSDSELGWATANGIVKGYSEDKFAPDDEITTEQAIAFAIRALNVLKAD